MHFKYVHKLCIYIYTSLIYIQVYIFETIIIYIYNAYFYLFEIKKFKIIKSWISLILIIIGY